MQGEGDTTKGDATTFHQSEREANERRKAQADKRRRGDNEEGHVDLLSGGGGSAVPPGANGDTQGILQQPSAQSSLLSGGSRPSIAVKLFVTIHLIMSFVRSLYLREFLSATNV